MKKNLITALLFFVFFVSDRYTLNRFIIAIATRPHSHQMIIDMKEQVDCAKKAGFVLDPPLLRLMTFWYRPDLHRGKTFLDLNIVLFAPNATYENIAHELGHIIDMQTMRKGHPLFEKIKDWPPESFAPTVGNVILEECKPGQHFVA